MLRMKKSKKKKRNVGLFSQIQSNEPPEIFTENSVKRSVYHWYSASYGAYLVRTVGLVNKKNDFCFLSC